MPLTSADHGQVVAASRQNSLHSHSPRNGSAGGQQGPGADAAGGGDGEMAGWAPRRVLIVSDANNDCRVLQTVFQMKGVPADISENPSDAVRMISGKVNGARTPPPASVFCLVAPSYHRPSI